MTGKVVIGGMTLALLIVATICTVKAVGWINTTFPGFLINERVRVSIIGFNWTGTKAGLRTNDKILEVNGEAIQSATDFKNIMKRKRPGELISYSIATEGTEFSATIPTMRFSWLDLLMTFGITLLGAILYLLMGVVVYIMKPNTRASWAFLLACFFLSLYTVTIFDIGATHIGFIRVYLLAATFFPAAFVHLSLFFPQPWHIIEQRPYLATGPYLIAAIIVIALQLLYPRDEFFIVWKLVTFYMALSALFIVGSILHSYFKSPSTISRQRAKVVLFGSSLAFPVPAFAFSVQNILGASGGLNIPTNLLTFPLIIFPGSIAFAIAKHNLFDVDVYIKRAVGYVIMTVLVGMGYFSIQSVTSTFVFKPLFGEYAENVFPIAFALLVVFFFDPINRKIQDTVDRVFFRQKFDYKETVRTVSNALTSMLNLDQILKKVVDTVRNEMFIDAAGVFVLEPQKRAHRNYFVEDEPPGTIANGQREVRVAYDDPLLALIAREKKLITTYDIQEDPIYSDLKESCGRSFVEMNASMALPLVYQGEVTGVLALGRKKSGHFYSREDIDLLDTMADQAAVAVENAKLAEQMKKEEGVRANLSRYLSPQIVDQIVKHNVEVNLGGDKKVVTVLFSDIRNFTTITESRKPDELVHQLNEYFTEMAGIIFEHGGSLDKYIGDAIVAVFGSLIDLDNSARNAAQAALKMMQRLPELNERWLQKYGLKMEFGIGLSTGEVFLGNIGSPERMEFTVIGDTVNVASRFSGLAKPGQILMTRETLNCLEGSLEWRELPPTEVKGKTGKLEVFQLVG